MTAVVAVVRASRPPLVSKLDLEGLATNHSFEGSYRGFVGLQHVSSTGVVIELAASYLPIRILIRLRERLCCFASPCRVSPDDAYNT